MDNNAKSKILIWAYRIFTFIAPALVGVYALLIEPLTNKDNSILAKLSAGGIFLLIVLCLVCVFLIKKHWRTQLNKITNELLECTDDSKKTELVSKKRNIEAKQEIFSNACLVAPFIIAWLLIAMVEKKVVSLRGDLMLLSISLLTGLGFNIAAQYFITKK